MSNYDIYLIYLRKSRADNPQESVEEVLARHERQLQELAVRIAGGTIPEEYIFREVVSGETIEDRPEIKKVLRAIENPSVKGVLVIEPQRLSRGDWEDGGKILSSFKYSNTIIYTPQKTYDLYDKFDYKFFKMELSQGNDYLEYIKEILARGRSASIREGNYIGSVAPYGYKKVMVDGAPTLEPYEPEAEAVRIAVNLRISANLGWSYIAHKLDNSGFSPRNGGKWNPYTLRDICLNPVNVGLIKIDDRKTVKVYEDGRLKTTRPRNKDVAYTKGRHTPILDPETYDKLIAVSGRTSREKKATELRNPLAGLLYCAKCGHAMAYRTYKTRCKSPVKPRLVCNYQTHCGTKSSSFADVYDAVIDSLECSVADFAFKLSHDQTQSQLDAHTRALTAAISERDKLDQRQEELYDLLEDHTYTREVFLRRNAKLSEERDAIEQRIEYLRNNVPKHIDYAEQISKFSDVIAALKDDSVSPKAKNTMLKSIVSRIEYRRDSSNRTKWDDSRPEITVILRDF